jgi:membrane protein YqaA with SNARE-associated domain
MLSLNFDLWLNQVFAWLAVPEQGLLALALVAFLAASVLPLSSEALLLAVVAAQPQHWGWALAVATLANTAGSVTTYWLGRISHKPGKPAPRPEKLEKYLAWFERYGSATLFFAWMPWLGDGLVLLAGWLKLNAWHATAWVGLGKLVRYAVVIFWIV